MPLSPIDIPTEFVELVISELKRKYDVDFTGYNRNFLRRRIASRMNRTGLFSGPEYNRLLMRNAREFSNLLQNLTINISEFMRDSEVYRILERRILPELAQINRGKTLSLWSAGCSRGEEPYSLAIILLKLGIPQQLPTRLVATDIDGIALDTAVRGAYEQFSLKNISEHDRHIFFRCLKNGTCCVSDRVKELVEFARHDIVRDPSLGSFDMIVCRNVSIYFTKAMQMRMYERFLGDLVPGGYLVTGMTETPPTRFGNHFAEVDFHGRIYRKVD